MAPDATAEERAQLEARLDQAEAAVKCFCASQIVCDECIEKLAQARAALDVDRHEDARSLVLQVESRLCRAHKSDRAMWRSGIIIACYEGLAVILLAYFAMRYWTLVVKPCGTQQYGWAPIIATAIWGGLGGAVAGLYGLYFHASRRDFDTGYIFYYFFKPLIGMAMGPVTLLFMKANLMASSPATEGTIQRVEFLYLGAFLIGYAERFWLRILDRVASALFGDTTPPTPAGPAAPPTNPKPPSPTPMAPLTPTATPAGATLRVTVEGPDADDADDISATLSRGSDLYRVEGPLPDADLAFVFEGLAPGKYELVVSKPGWRQVPPAKPVEIASGQSEASETVTLDPSRSDGGEPPGDGE